MNKLSLFPLAALVALFLCQCKPDPSRLPNSKDYLSEKNFPNEGFYLQRAYPDASMDLKAFEKGLKQARFMALEKGIGFDGEWTVQGPGNIGARVNTVAVNPINEDIIFVGFSSGGVWRTTDGGANWSSVFDEQLWPSVGDIVIDPNNPETIYIATGDPNISFYPMLGDGIYKSTDGGDSWTNIGLKEHRVLTKIILHPTDPNILYAASMGLPFVRNNLRGLYKTTNGGASWQQVLSISDQAGVTDVVMDPFNPNVLYASGWDRIRTNMESLVSGPGAKVFKTTDGGASWTLMEAGLPIGEQGRTGLAISENTPGLVYAMFVGTDSNLEGIYKTTDAGASWSPIDVTNLEGALGGFGWYFGRLEIAPTNDDELYLLGVELWRRDPQSLTWSEANPPWWQYAVHADKHDLAFSSVGNLYLGTDGGLYKSTDGSVTWTDIENIPTTQFYRVAYNPHEPDNYYGGAQDNGTTGGNASNINDWPRIYGGDGFQPVFHPDDPLTFYAETQNGNIVVTDDGGISFFGADDGMDGNDRRNWDMPYIMSPHDPNVLYAGTFRLYKNESGAFPFYTPISEDLTDGLILNPRHHNITAISESPITQGLLFIGTADGNVWHSPNDGGTWNNVSAGLPDRYVTSVKASPTNVEWLYATHSGYRDNEFIPRIHRSKNLGQDWEDISEGLPDLAINDVFVLPDHADSVLFVATDAGVYASLTSGQTWKRLGVNMPFVPTFDLDWNVAHNELIAGTFARSIMTYPIDSLLQMAPPDSTSSTRPTLALNRQVEIFPNPATTHIVITAPGFANRSSEIAITDKQGRLVKKITTSGNLNIRERVEVATFPSGEYFIKIKTGQVVRSGVFLKI